MKTNILFLIKQSSSYGEYTSTPNSGLKNASEILQNVLNNTFVKQSVTEICVDANEIDKYLTRHQPKYCIIEAMWVTPAKMREICKLHQFVVFITRIHSRIPFLAMEGNAISWLKEINEIKNSFVSANHEQTARDLNNVGIYTLYLPNIYKKIPFIPSLLCCALTWFTVNKPKRVINIGCFGAIRPLKNQLIQAFAAMTFADRNNVQLKFHINGSRIEQKGDAVLKNIRGLFENTNHVLVEHGWLNQDEFNEVLKKMDVGMQVSFTESFNIVTADMIYNRVPVVVSKEISWVSNESKVDPNSVEEMVDTIESVVKHKHRNLCNNLLALNRYNNTALESWEFLF